MDTVGIIELNSIARGIEVADNVLKAAEVEMLRANTVCPGKYLLMISGNVGAVKAAIETGVYLGAEYVVESKVITRIDDRVIKAISGTNEITELKALGVMEFFDVTSAINAADKAIKTADVEIIEVRMGYAVGGKAFVTLTGDLSAVNAAVENGIKSGLENCMLVNKTVIPSPRKELLESLI